MKGKLSVKVRLTLWYAALTAMIGACALYIMSAVSKRAQMDHCTHMLESAAVIIMDEMEIEHGIVEIDADIDEVPNVYASLYALDGELIYGRRRVETPFEPGVVRPVSQGAHSWVILDTRIDVPEHEPMWLRVHMSSDLTADMGRRLMRIGFWLIPLLILLAVAGGYAIAHHALLPVREMTHAAASIADGGDLAGSRTLSRYEAGSDELHALAKTLEDMLSRLDASFEHERQFTSDAAHELRTPLNALRTQGEYALSCSSVQEKDDAIARMLERIEAMRQLIDQLLLIARLDAGQITMEDEVPLAKLISDVAQDMEPLAQERGIRILTAFDDAVVPGNRAMLTRVVVNLADNAIRYGREGGEVRISLSRQGADAVISVEDDGVGIAAEALDHVFERFWRGDLARSTPGTGIGLAIVQSAVRAHGGSVHVKSDAGSGCCFTVRLPVKER